ncbi:AAA family ATPase [Streptomyces sp. MB09-02B]|uniref:AAA family ATPase n=1 Tax=Streptomyces sp. MB09-02B TaxID=3028667 RepID=UPI0029ACF4FF|nr:AAA family ATPase [Streptomyces sp. MB09-02B]MDX3642920.1 AAA family ATPase [Streptomyces sp. MB09-02B]
MSQVTENVPILPYSRVVAQDDLKLALELNHVVPRIGGVLMAGVRGTAKSTLVRAFALMVHTELPVTLPINATDDRVVGGWQLEALMRGEARPQPGLLEEAAEKGLLYVDEVNLLDDHLVNIILDVVSTGVLSVQREGLATAKHLSFGLVGTMNPEEGWLRPQLLDRFGLMVAARHLDAENRHRTVKTVLAFEEEWAKPESAWLREAARDNEVARERLRTARERAPYTRVPDEVSQLAAEVAQRVDAVGQRGEIVATMASQALAALENVNPVEPRHLLRVVPMAFRHRRPETAHGGTFDWGPEDEARVKDLFDIG